jgi:hypothetical protein
MNPKIIILKILAACGAIRPTRPTIKAECECRLGGDIGDTELDAALTELTAAQMIASKIDPITSDHRYAITRQGLAYLENGNV